MSHSIQATDAKAKLAELLRAVERGESFEITRHGKVVAHLLPASAVDLNARRASVARFRQKRKKWTDDRFSTQEILAARHEGHRA